MIISDKGRIQIEGRSIDTIIEWVVLYKQMIENHPELVAETCIAYEHELLNADANPLQAALVKSIVLTVKEKLKNE